MAQRRRVLTVMFQDFGRCKDSLAIFDLAEKDTVILDLFNTRVGQDFDTVASKTALELFSIVTT